MHIVLTLVAFLIKVSFSSFVIPVEDDQLDTMLERNQREPTTDFRATKDRMLPARAQPSNVLQRLSSCPSSLHKWPQSTSIHPHPRHMLAPLDILCPVIVPWNICILQLD